VFYIKRNNDNDGAPGTVLKIIIIRALKITIGGQ
jgi:hypothetical protein